MENINYEALLKDHPNKWVALSSDSSRVVGVADNVKEAVKQASKNKEDSPVLTKTPEHYGTFVL